MEIPKHYDPADVEDKWYAFWERQGYFHSEPDDRAPFSIVIPPPNVTGVLHMGHMLNNTVQDILVRKARLDGKNACWVPGTDHASIATEAKVVRLLREKGIRKGDLTREEFMEYAWEWREKYGGIILQQLKRLGASCDWDRTAFTLDEKRSRAVIDVFVDLYNKGKIYRGLRMINWDPEAQTVLSNEEVLYSDEDASLYHVRYRVVESDGWITVATTRPETILGDTAIAVHPDDERYAGLVGKTVEVPLIRRHIPIIADNYVDREFGTGALKITPAHDPNDYEIGLRHDLEVIDTLNPDGTLSEKAEYFIGESRETARKLMADWLDENGQLVSVENYRHSVGRSERTNALVEPRLSLQWFVDMKSLAGPALRAVMEEEIKFFPSKYRNIYRHWMENIRDWCISRQLWWGQRIPAFYLDGGDGEDLVFVATTAEEALAKAIEETGNPKLTVEDMRQDEDVVDTWFSSWLWPITVFNGFESEEDVRYYYPTSVLVTGWDIIFLWVARMIMAGYEWLGQKPFEHVYFTGMVRDKKGRKMSKSLGNSPDALKLIDDYGADGVRFGILSSSPAGGDLLFDEKLCQQGRNFCNKMWNALRLIKGWSTTDSVDESHAEKNALARQWIDSRLNVTIVETQEKFESYKLSDALIGLYKFVWGDFCSWYLEMIKPASGDPVGRRTYNHTIELFEKICILLHPYMPFITEEIWHKLKNRDEGEDCMVARFPEAGDIDSDLLADVSLIEGVITKVRELRNSNGVPQSRPVKLYALDENAHRDGADQLVRQLANVSEVHWSEQGPREAVLFIVEKHKYWVELPVERNIEEERGKLEQELEYQRGFVKSVSKKLENERFVQNAPEAVVEKERKKLKDGMARIKAIEESLELLN